MCERPLNTHCQTKDKSILVIVCESCQYCFGIRISFDLPIYLFIRTKQFKTGQSSANVLDRALNFNAAP